MDYDNISISVRVSVSSGREGGREREERVPYQRNLRNTPSFWNWRVAEGSDRKKRRRKKKEKKKKKGKVRVHLSVSTRPLLHYESAMVFPKACHNETQVT
jgi:hypothetical protein